MSKLIIRTYQRDMPVGEIINKDLERLKQSMTTYLDILGSPLYHLGEGRITGHEGWKLFNQTK